MSTCCSVCFDRNWSNVSHPRLQSIQSFPLKSCLVLSPNFKLTFSADTQLTSALIAAHRECLRKLNFHVLWSELVERVVVEGLEDLISYLNKRRVCWHCENTFRIFASRYALVGWFMQHNQCAVCVWNQTQCYFTIRQHAHEHEKNKFILFRRKTFCPRSPEKIRRKQFTKRILNFKKWTTGHLFGFGSGDKRIFPIVHFLVKKKKRKIEIYFLVDTASIGFMNQFKWIFYSLDGSSITTSF